MSAILVDRPIVYGSIAGYSELPPVILPEGGQLLAVIRMCDGMTLIRYRIGNVIREDHAQNCPSGVAIQPNGIAIRHIECHNGHEPDFDLAFGREVRIKVTQ